jgi:hypothetical protein
LTEERVDAVLLSRVSPKASLVEALDRIRSGTGGVVVDGDEGPHIVTADAILAAWNKAVDSHPAKNPDAVEVGTIPWEGRRVPTPSLPRSEAAGIEGHIHGALRENEAAGPRIPLEQFGETRWRLEAHFRPFGTDSYAVRPLRKRSALVFTAPESPFKLGQSVTICACVGDPVHRFRQNGAAKPVKCIMPHGVGIDYCRKI